MTPAHRSALLLLAAAVGCSTAAHAQTWDGGGANDAWTTANNWNPNTVPLNDGTAAIIFRGTLRLGPVVNAPVSVRSIAFGSPAGSFVITNDDLLHATLSVSNGVLNSDNSLQSITCPVRLSASQTFGASSGPLAFVVVSGMGFGLTINGAFDTSMIRLTGTDTTLTKVGSGILTIAGASTYTGATTISAGALLATNSSGSATGSGPVSITGSGKLRGTGLIGGPVQNDATVEPGDTVGTLAVQNTYTQGSGGTLSIQIAGPTDSDHGRLAITGAATLGGTLSVTALNGYTPARGDSFEILTASSITGEFTTLNLPTPTNNSVWQVAYFSSSVRLFVSNPAPITFQGRLKNGAQPASGLHDFQFRLFDAATGGNQVVGTQCNDNVPVSDGLFAATFDFGDQSSTPAPRFLEVRARADTGLSCSDPTGFTVLGARQRILPNPCAAHADAAFALDAPDGLHPNAVFVDDAGQIGIGTTAPQAAVHVVTTTGEAVRIQGPLAGPSNGAWLGFADSNDASAGYVGDVSSADRNISLSSTAGDVALFTATGAALTAKVGGNVGIGTTSPAAKLDVRGDIALGGSGQFRAVSNEDNVRIIRGVICGNGFAGCDGTIIAGSGFTLTHPSTGHYNITFNTPFSATPSISATAQGVGSDEFTEKFVMTQSPLASGVNFQVFNRDGGDFSPSTIHFVAIGPR